MRAALPGLMVVICAQLVATSALADTNLRRFEGSALGGVYMTADGANGLETGSVRASLLGNFESKPVNFVSDGEQVGRIVQSRLTLDAGLAVGAMALLDVGIVLPMTVSQTGESLVESETLSGYVLGDPRVSARVKLYQSDDNRLAMATTLGSWIPMGDGDNFARYGGPGGKVGLNLDYRPLQRLTIAFSGGYHARPKGRIANVTVDDELTATVAANFHLRQYELIAETSMATDAFSPFNKTSATAGEMNGAVRVTLGGEHGLLLGAGVGLLPGVGSPLWRSFLGYSVSSRWWEDNPPPRYPGQPSAVAMIPKLPSDLDGDGLPNDMDRCPNIPEDPDGFRDEDGCPEPDNDLDLIVDGIDRSPSNPEDWDGQRDGDGSPDTDNDADGIADADDRCPNEAGAGDGCPGSPIDWQSELARQAQAGPRVHPLVIGRLILPGTPLKFHPARDSLSDDSVPVVAALAQYIRKHPSLVRIEVGVHAKTSGTAADDLRRSDRRARALTQALASQGVDPLRLFPVAYGRDNRVWQDGLGLSSQSSRVELKALRSFEPAPTSPTLARATDSKAKGESQVEIVPVSDDIRFKARSANLRASSKDSIAELAQLLMSSSGRKAEIAVHTSGLGNPKKMLELSQRRADALVAALVSLGVPQSQLTARGYGGKEKRASEKTQAGRMENRRVELRWQDSLGDQP